MGAGETGAAVRARDQAERAHDRAARVPAAPAPAVVPSAEVRRHPAAAPDEEPEADLEMCDHYFPRSSTTPSCTFGLSAASALFSRVGCTRFVRKTR